MLAQRRNLTLAIAVTSGEAALTLESTIAGEPMLEALGQALTGRATASVIRVVEVAAKAARTNPVAPPSLRRGPALALVALAIALTRGPLTTSSAMGRVKSAVRSLGTRDISVLRAKWVHTRLPLVPPTLRPTTPAKIVRQAGIMGI